MDTPLNILVVEDSADTREELVDFLSARTWQVHAAGTVADAEAMLATVAVDMLILDLTLPDGAGLDLAARLRVNQPAIGIIMLSGRALPVDRRAGYVAGADVYLTKPADPEELLAVIETLSVRLPQRAGLPSSATLTLQRQAGRLSRGDDWVQLTSGEVNLLAFLATRPDCEATSFAILDDLAMHGMATYSRENLAVLVSRLRQKTSAAIGCRLVVAIRGYGYKLAEPLQLV